MPKPLAEHDPRVHIIPKDPYAWSSYKDVEEQGLLDDVISTPWSEGG
jgi:hypothetical protein